MRERELIDGGRAGKPHQQHCFVEASNKRLNFNKTSLLKCDVSDVVPSLPFPKASVMLERKVIVNVGPFRHAVIADCICFFFFFSLSLVFLLSSSFNCLDLPNFAHVLALSKLASFLDETHIESKKPQKPFLICAFNERRNTFLVAGFVGFGIRGRAKLKYCLVFVVCFSC